MNRLEGDKKMGCVNIWGKSDPRKSEQEVQRPLDPSMPGVFEKQRERSMTKVKHDAKE